MQKIFERLFHIRPGESRLFQAFFLLNVCIGMFMTVGFSVGDSLFLTYATQDNGLMLYAWGHVGIAIVTVLVTWLYSKVTDVFSRISIIVGLQSLLLLSLVAFRQGMAFNGLHRNSWVYFGLGIWLKVCGQVLTMLFFSFAGDYFTTHDAKRVYPYLVGGQSVGSIIAGSMIEPVVSVMGSENMLYPCIGFLMVGIGLSLFIHKIGMPVTQPAKAVSEERRGPVPLKTFIAQPYLRLVFLLVFLGVNCFVIVDFQMKVSAKAVYRNSVDLTAFLGNFYMYVGIVELVFQFLGTELLLRKVGLLNCLLILPTVHTVMSLLFYATGYGLFTPWTFLIITLANFFRVVLSESLELPARELLCLPLPTRLRIRAQAILKGVIEPVSQGIGGLLVIGLTTFGIRLSQYSLGVVGFALGWVMMLLLVRPRYRDILVSSLHNHQLDTRDLRDLVRGTHQDFILEGLLNNADEQIVGLTLDLLRDRPIGHLTRQLRQLGVGPNPEIAAKAIEVLGIDGDRGHLETLAQAFQSPSDCVREAAVLAFCRIKKDEALEFVSQWLQTPDQVIRHAALIGCGRYCGPQGVRLTQPILSRMAASQVSAERVMAARLLRDMQNAAYTAQVEPLLSDPDLTVRIAAIEACGAMQSPDLAPRLLQLYRSPDMRAAVFAALAQMPAAYVPAIVEAAHDPTLDEASCDLLLQVLASIGGKTAQKALWTFFGEASSVVIRMAAGNALQQMAAHCDQPEISKSDIEATLKRLCEHIELLNQACQKIGGQSPLSWQLLHDHARLEIECLFQLLAFRYPTSQVEKIRYNFFSSMAMQRANALELLDDLLPRPIASGLIQLLDAFLEGPSSERNGLSEQIVRQLMQRESWVRVVTFYYLRKNALPIGDRLTEPEQMLYGLLEQIAFLKKVPLFKDVPGNALVPLAKIVRPVRLKTGAFLFRQGERGDAMYLIRQGAISVQVNGSEINRMGIGECIGEMSILDGAPRSASCVATEETELLHISDKDFEMLVKSQTSVALAVLRTLADRLRRQTALTPGPPGMVIVPAKPDRGILSADQPRPEPFSSETQGGSGFSAHEHVLYHFFEKISFLKKVPLFKDIPETYLVPLANIAQAVSLKPDEILFRQGDPGHTMYLVCKGTISVQKNGVEISQIERGDCLGEMSVVDGAPRSASCIAKSEVELLCISDKDFETILKSQTSILLAVFRTLAERLRRQTG